MAKWLAVFLYSMLFIAAIYNLISDYNRKRKINLFICFQSAFILYYIFIPIAVQFLIIFCNEQLNGFARIIGHSDSYAVINTCILTIITYFLIMVVYHVKATPNSKDSSIIYNSINYDDKSGYADRRIFQIAVALGITALIIGAAAEIYIACRLGGIYNAIAMGDRLRAFESDRTSYISQDNLYILILMVSSVASTYFFVYALRIYRSIGLYILLILSIFASSYYLIFNAGRLGILLFAFTFLLDFSFRKTKHPFVFVFLFLIFSLFMLDKMDDLFSYLSYGYIKENSNSIVSIINEFSFPYLNLLNVFKINNIYGLRWGVDFVSWIINVIPTKILSLFGLNKITSQYIFITEYYNSISSISGGIPTDMLTLSIRQFGVLGIIPVSIVLSILCKYLDEIIDSIYSDKFVFITLRISSIMFIIVAYADLDSFVRSKYDMLMVLMFSIIASKLRNRIGRSMNKIYLEEC